MTALLVILVTLVTSTLRSATPLMLASLGGLFSERSGIINIGLEGIMLMGAWAAVYGSYLTGSAGVGLLFAIGAGLLVAALHAVACIHWKANQVVSGVAINLLGAGFTEYMMTRVWGQAGQSPSVNKVPDLVLPYIGGINWFVFIAFALVLLSHFVLWHTPWGLRLRSVGEHPLAADTVGINVYKMRWHGVLLSGLFAGLAGASLSIGLVSIFTNGMTAGRGFIALAAMIFGKWTPLGAMAAALLFGAADALGIVFQTQGIPVPNEFLYMVPYVLTMLTLAGLVGRATPPAALGTSYDKSH